MSRMKHYPSPVYNEKQNEIVQEMVQETEIIKVKNDHRSKFSNLSNWKEEA